MTYRTAWDFRCVGLEDLPVELVHCFPDFPGLISPSPSPSRLTGMPVQGKEGVQRAGVQVERPGGRFPAIHSHCRYAEFSGELGDGETAPPAQPGHPFSGGSDVAG